MGMFNEAVLLKVLLTRPCWLGQQVGWETIRFIRHSHLASSILVSEFDAFEHQQVFIRVVLFRQSLRYGFFLSVFLSRGGRFNWCLLSSLQHGQRSSCLSIMALLAQERFNFHVLSPEAG